MEFSSSLPKNPRVETLTNAAEGTQNLPSSSLGESLQESGVGDNNEEIQTDNSLAPDEHERADRYKSVAVEEGLSNSTAVSAVAAPPGVVVNKIMEASQLKEHWQICTKLFSENKISAKNAWELNIIDIINQLVNSEQTDNVLKVGGTSLDISAKVYGLRVDDVHSRGLQLAGAMSETATKGNEDNDEPACEGDMGQGGNKKAVKKKKNIKMTGEKKNVIDYDDKNIYSELPQMESVSFWTKQDRELSAQENLLTMILPVNASTHEFDLMINNEKFWTTAADELLSKENKSHVYPELQNMLKESFNTTKTICSPLHDFVLCNWNPDDEENPLDRENMVPAEVVLDDDGFPIAELDGSIHDIFDNKPDAPVGEILDDNEGQHQAQIHGNFEPVVDAIPEENRQETDYGYNVLLKTGSGMIIDKIWAGPSHWKLKCLRPSMPRYSGSVLTNAPKKRKKRSEAPIKPVDFYNIIEPDLKHKLVINRKPRQADQEKITLPAPDLIVLNFLKNIDQLHCKPGVDCRDLKKPAADETEPTSADCEIQVDNDENPSGSQHSSQLTEDKNNHEPMENSFEGAAQQSIPEDNLVNAPTTTRAYALHAKKMDIKKLEAAVWKCLIVPENQNDQLDKSAQEVIPCSFQNLYRRLPQYLTPEMVNEISRPLVFTALLHLCNENNLLLIQPEGPSPTDFQITKAF